MLTRLRSLGASFFLLAACATSPAEPSRPSLSSESVSAVASEVSVSPAPTTPGQSIGGPADEFYPTNADMATNTNASPKTVTVFDGTRYFSVWSDDRFGTPQLWGSYTTEDGDRPMRQGVRLNALGRPAAAGGDIFTSYYQRDAFVAASSVGALVARTVPSGISSVEAVEVSRVAPNGTVSNIVVTGSISRYTTGAGQYSLRHPVQVTADASGFCIVYFRNGSGDQIDLVYRRVGSNGDVSEPRVLAAPFPSDAIDTYLLMVASNPNGVLAIWSGSPAGGGSQSSYLAASAFAGTAVNPVRALPATQYIGQGYSSLVAHTGGFRYLSGSDAGVVLTNVDQLGAAPVTSGPVLPSGFGANGAQPDPTTTGFVVAASDGVSNCVVAVSGAGVPGTCTPVPLDAARKYGVFGEAGFAVGTKTLFDNSPPAFNDRTAAPAELVLRSKASLEIQKRVQVSESARNEMYPSLASNGTDYLLVWTDTRISDKSGEQAVFAQRLNAEGEPSGEQLQVSNGDVGNNSAPRAIFDGTKYFVAWTELYTSSDRALRRVSFAEVSASGALSLGNKGTLAENQYIESGGVAVASDATNRIVVWSSRTQGGSGIVGMRVGIASGAPLDSQPQLVSSPTQTFKLNPDIAHNGTRTLVTWFEQSGFSFPVHAAYVDKGEISPKEPDQVVHDNAQVTAAARLAASENDFLLVTHQFASVDLTTNVVAKFITQDGRLVGVDSAGVERQGSAADIPIAVGAFDARAPVVVYAKDEANFVAAWADDREGTYDIRATWVDAKSGRVRDPLGLLMTSLPTVEANPAIAVASGGRGVIAYQELASAGEPSSFRIRTRRFESGLLIGSACTSNEACGTRLCVEGVCCESACDSGCGTCAAVPGRCTPKPKTARCGKVLEYQCDGTSTSCPLSCRTNQECPSGSCVNGLCDPPQTLCINEFTQRDEVGNLTPCGDYRCRFNACRKPCIEVDDCATGLICAFDGTCVAPPPVTIEEGCALSNQSRAPGSAWPLLVGVASAFAAVRRRVRNRSVGGGRK